MATGAKPAYDASRFYVWHALGNLFSIELSLNVVSKLSQEQSRAAAESPQRNIGGILLGRSRDEPDRASIVEDFVLAGPSEKALGLPSEDDACANLTNKLIRGTGERHVIGFFRAMCDGTLAPNDEDLTNASRLFGEPDNVLLLIRFQPGDESEAALFYWDHELCDSGPTFAFDVAKLTASSQASTVIQSSVPDIVPGPVPISAPRSIPYSVPNSVATFTPPTVPISIPNAVAVSRQSSFHHTLSPPIRQPQTERRRPFLWAGLLPTFAFFVILTVGIRLWPSLSQEVDPITEASAVDVSPLGLKVTAQPHQLEIRWNHDSTQVLAAEKAMLHITEGAMTEGIPVDRQELRDGYVAYSPKTSDVNIRFEVTGPSGRVTSESVRVVAKPE